MKFGGKDGHDEFISRRHVKVRRPRGGKGNKLGLPQSHGKTFRPDFGGLDYVDVARSL